LIENSWVEKKEKKEKKRRKRNLVLLSLSLKISSE